MWIQHWPRRTPLRHTCAAFPTPTRRRSRHEQLPQLSVLTPITRQFQYPQDEGGNEVAVDDPVAVRWSVAWRNESANFDSRDDAEACAEKLRMAPAHQSPPPPDPT